MKRKLFSAILFGALLTASTSGLTSCKDYDDDISNLQSQIDKLATADQLSAKVSEMQAAISAAQSAAESKAAAAQSVADAASKAADAAAAAAKAAQSTADAASKDAAAAAAAAAEVQKAADKAIADLEAKAATKADLEAAAKAAEEAVKAIQEAHATDKAEIEKAIKDGLDAVKAEIAKTNDDLAALAKRLDAVETKLAALEAGEGQEEALKAIQEEVEAVADALEAIIGEYTSMVTAVSLYASEEIDTDDLLKFVYVSQEKDTKFPATEGVADEQIEFSSKNKNIMTTDKLLVRVSPTNAVLNAANISLLNSQGADLSDYVEVKAVKPYEELILGTRAAVEGNGLWEVEFKVKDGVDAAKFADAVTVKKGLTTYAIKYAVAVQNTESEETRRVISAYDVEVQPEEYEPANNRVAVTNRDGKWFSIDWIKNRYYYNSSSDFGVLAENGQKKSKVAELAWENEPQVEGSTTGLVNAARNDARTGWDLVDVEVGKSIDIFVGSNYAWSSEGVVGTNWKNNLAYLVKGFYVVLDSEFAIESAPSEINAWESYSYTNVGVPGDSKRPAKMFYGNEGSISIDSPAALGDIIGFRVYVVNLDGTLVDPDGRAFYVNVAKEKVTTPAAADELVATLHPTKDGDKYEYHFAGDVESNYYVKADLTDAAKNAAASATGLRNLKWTITKNASAYGNNSVDPVYGKDYSIDIVDKKTITVTILHPWMFLDEGTYTAVATLKNSNGTEICDLSVDFKKTLPTAAPVLAWNPAYNPANQIFANAAPDDADIYKIAKGSAPQAVELSDIMGDLTYGNLNSSYPAGWYILEFANAKADDKGKFTKVLTVPNTLPTVEGPENAWEAISSDAELADHPAVLSSYILEPAAGAIDNASHSIAYKYNFGWISMTYNYQTAAYSMGECVRYAAQPLAMTFASWIHYENVVWAEGAKPTITYSPGNAGKEAAKINLLGTTASSKTVWSKNGVYVAGFDNFAHVNLTSLAGGATTLPTDGILTYRKNTKFDNKWHLFYLPGAMNFSGHTVSGTVKGYWVVKADGKYWLWDNVTANNNGTGAPLTANQFVELPEDADYCEDDHTLPGETKAEVFRFVASGTAVATVKNNLYKKVSTGDYYRVAYDAASKTYKFCNASGVIYNNQTEKNVTEKYDASTNNTLLADGKSVLAMWTPSTSTTDPTGSILIAWNTMIRNYQGGKSMFGESEAKFVDFISLYTKGYITQPVVTADSASPFDIELVGNDLVFTNKVGQLNPGTTGKLKITAKDCFGQKKEWSLDYNIAQ